MPSFAEALYNLPTERLRRLVQTRQLDTKKLALIPNKKQLAQHLSTELSKPGSAAEAITQCNARELRLLQLLMGAENEQVMSWPTLLDAAGGQDLSEALQGVAARLEDLGLAFRLFGKDPQQPNGMFLPTVVRQSVPASLSDRYTLERCLDQYDAVSLKRICDMLGLPPETKTANVKAIKAHLLANGSARNLKRPLNAEEVEVLEYLVQSGGAATAIEAATATLDNHAEDFFRYDWQNRWKQGKERNAIDTLLARGLLYVVSYGYGYNLFLIIPGDLLRALSGSGDMAFWTAPPLAPVPLPTPPARTSRHIGLLRDVVALLGFVSAQDAVRTNTGHIHKTSLKNLMRGLSIPQERYASFLYAVCREAGLIATAGDKQVYKITPSGNSWLHGDSVTQLRVLVEAWRQGILWSEMYNDPLHKSNDYRSREAVLRMRHAALNILREAAQAKGAQNAQGENRSENIQETQAQKAHAQETQANQTPANQNSISNDASRSPFYDLASVTETLTFRYPLLLASSSSMGPDLVPSPTTFIRLLVGECLYWLAAAELALPEAENRGLDTEGIEKEKGKRGDETGPFSLRPSSFVDPRGAASSKPALPDATGYRLTEIGAFLLDVEGAPLPAPEPREDQFIVQANGEIFLSPYLHPATLYYLLAMTETPAKGATGNTVSLTRDSIRRCLDQGEKPRDVLAFLQSHTRTGIPQNVEYLINDVGGKHGHIHLGKAQMYLQVDTPLLLKELEARKELKPFFVRALSDTVAVLKAEDPDKLLRELRKGGYLPVNDDETPHSLLNAKFKPTAPLIAPSTSAKGNGSDKKRAAKDDDGVDWERIAQDDSRPFQTGKSEAGANSGTINVLRNQTLIKTMLVQACKMRIVVEIEYQEQGSPTPTHREIEPERVMGNFLNALDRNTRETLSFNIARIQWARLTGERFHV